jgi:hypothetical protein
MKLNKLVRQSFLLGGDRLTLKRSGSMATEVA